VDGIGESLTAFHNTLYAAVVANAALFVFTFRAFENVLPNVREMYVFAALVVFMFLAMRQLERIYPDVPKKTQVQVERERVIFSRVVSGDDVPQSSTLYLDENMLGFALDKVRAILANRAKVNKATMVRHLPLLFSYQSPLPHGFLVLSSLRLVLQFLLIST